MVLTTVRTHTPGLQRELSALTSTTRIYHSRSRDSGNRIVHWDSLCSMIGSNVVCRDCGGDVKLTEATTGIATQIKLTCKSCAMMKKSLVRRTAAKKQKFRMDSSESFALNCQFVIGLMQVGGGSAEAGVLLTFLDLPHSSTYQRHTFAKVQLAIRPEIKKSLRQNHV